MLLNSIFRFIADYEYIDWHLCIESFGMYCFLIFLLNKIDFEVIELLFLNLYLFWMDLRIEASIQMLKEIYARNVG